MRFGALGRWLPPAYTPIPFAGLARVAGRRLVRGDDEPALLALLGDRYEAACVVLTDSATNALQLALRAAVGTRERDRPRVVLPAFACFDLITAALGAGVDPVFFDVSPETLDPDPESFERAIGGDVAAVVLAPLFGLPGGWPGTGRQARERGVYVVEDAAQGFGSQPGGRPAGTLGDASVLSFGRGKGWTGSGGGALLLRDRAASVAGPQAPRPGSLPVLLKGAAQWLLGHPSRYGIPASIPSLHLGETRYHPPSTPRRISRASASLVLASLQAATRESEHRRRNAESLIERIGEAPRFRRDAGYLRLPILLPTEESAEGFAHAHRRLGIERSYPTALPDLPALGRSTHSDRFPGARALAARLVTVPTHSHLRERDVERLAELVRAAGGRIVGPTAD